MKQWLYEYRTERSGTFRQDARLRQYHLNNLIKWRVSSVISLLFILLQFSLILFFAGLLVLLWHFHAWQVAAAATALISIIAAFIVVTTLLPVFVTGCCYLTPLTYFFYYLYVTLLRLYQYPTRRLLYRGVRLASEWWAPPGTGPGSSAYLYLQPLTSWHVREQNAINTESTALDIDLIVKAIVGKVASTDVTYPPETVALHLLELSRSAASDCVAAVLDAHKTLFLSADTTYDTSTVPLDFWIAALLQLLKDGEKGPNEETVKTQVNAVMAYLTRAIARGGWQQADEDAASFSSLRLLLALSAIGAHAPPALLGNTVKLARLVHMLFYDVEGGRISTVRHPWKGVQYGQLPVLRCIIKAHV